MQIATPRTLTPLLLLLLSGSAIAGSALPDTLTYTVRPGDSLLRIASRERAATNHYAVQDLLDAIVTANGLQGALIRPGQVLRLPVVPRVEPPRVADIPGAGTPYRGIYLSGPVCGTRHVFPRVDAFINAGGNAVVFDVKDADGGVSFRSRQDLAGWGKGRNAPVISSLDELLRRFRERGLHVTARVACFLAGDLGRARPDLALLDADGAPWAERDQIWVNPADPEVQDYVIGLALEAAAAGVDEIQFDYVRCPTNAWTADAPDDPAARAARRRAVITGFLARADSALAAYPVEISADLYGIMAWGRLADRAVTGQHIADIARHVDVLCPMVYPSHYKRGYHGFDDPADHPGYFVGEPTRRFLAQAQGRARVRPWLQAFPYRVDDYGAGYVAVQIHAALDAGADGWLLWNPASMYGEALAAVMTGAPVPSAWVQGPQGPVSPPLAPPLMPRQLGLP
ncbi:LysM peptidoglycan-binding domain-containing protein [bacterium]|nr:LysM peptidoglycan-binding domain-containing protein [bacterium]